jgi:hypothetical protein
MKKSIYLIITILVTLNCFSQKINSHYKKVYAYDDDYQGWALVKTIANTYGYIDKNGKEVVPSIYSKIYPFETKNNTKKYAMIKNVAGAYGFIDENGKEFIQGIYWKKEDAIQQLNILLNKV